MNGLLNALVENLSQEELFKQKSDVEALARSYRLKAIDCLAMADGCERAGALINERLKKLADQYSENMIMPAPESKLPPIEMPED